MVEMRGFEPPLQPSRGSYTESGLYLPLPERMPLAPDAWHVGLVAV